METREGIIHAIRLLAQQKGRNWLSRVEFLTESGISAHHLQKHFSSWNEAVETAGLNPLDYRGRPDQPKGLTQGDLIQAASELVERLGRRTISQAEFTREVGISYRPIHRLFGTWEQFADVAGLQLHLCHKTPIPSEELFKEFFRLASELGHLPNCQELRHAKYSKGTFENRFKTYSKFRVNAIQYGIEHGLVEPDVAKRELSKPHRQPQETGRFEPLNDRPILGERIDFRGLLHAPVNELGVVYLFGIVAQDLGFVVESVQSGFPDCEAKRRLSKGRWQTVRIEFEFLSSNFLSHGHDLGKCVVIVCWEHDWTDCPIEVVSLKDTVIKMKG